MQTEDTGANFLNQDEGDCINKLKNNKQINFNSINAHLHNLG